MPRLKLLFVCGRNRRRSPTAETLFRNDPRLSVRSAGTSDSSRRKIRQEDLDWADLVLVMEKKYEARIRARFPDMQNLPSFHSLEIFDEYEFMDEELIQILTAATEEAISVDKNQRSTQ